MGKPVAYRGLYRLHRALGVDDRSAVTRFPHCRQRTAVGTECRCVPWVAAGLLVMVLLLCSSGAAIEWIASPTVKVEEEPRRSPNRGIVLLSANLRDAPSMQSEVVGVAREGTLLDIFEEKGSWFRVKVEGRVEAWIHKSLLRVEPMRPEPEPLRPASSDPVPPANVGAFAEPSPPVVLPLLASETPPPREKPPDTVLIAQPIAAAEPAPSTPGFEFPALFDVIAAYVQGSGGYFLAGLVVILIVSIGLQLRAARQLKRTMREMNHLLEMVETLQAESPAAPVLSPQPEVALAHPSRALPSHPAPMIPFTPVERAVLDTIAEHGELHERELGKILASKGFSRVLIKAVIGDLVRKTAVDGLPWVEVRYAQGRYTYRLRGQGKAGARYERWQEYGT
jgi:hypothetical protein